ncbi:MAG: hypothetical protein H6707_10775 [Deltaproteobacteria bacterium]|nr:hypothetical protein [Deltaproteobacteria bacterium]
MSKVSYALAALLLSLVGAMGCGGVELEPQEPLAAGKAEGDGAPTGWVTVRVHCSRAAGYQVNLRQNETLKQPLAGQCADGATEAHAFKVGLPFGEDTAHRYQGVVTLSDDSVYQSTVKKYSNGQIITKGDAVVDVHL